MKTFRNPILPGFYPDPSICRVGEDYYMVTSSFEYYPGVPIFHSKDLIHWRQLGHVLDRPSQLNLDDTPSSRGIYAATIRYFNGMFYVVSTFVVSATGERRNFYVTAKDPEGTWSDPVWLPGAVGIDPSLFFDDDGKVYYTGNRKPPEGQQYEKHVEIWLQELDLEEKQLTGPTFSLWDGALKQIHATEGPHLYKINGYYYLVVAEGGTGHTHSTTIARSKTLTGPYEVAKTNPILTHRHLGRSYPIVNVGHSDFIETQNGEWYLVCLASRPYGGNYRNLGRETFLVPFVWEDGWPVVNPGKGIVEFELLSPNLPLRRWPSLAACDHFDAEILDYRWNFIRTPRGDFWSLSERPGHLRLRLKPETITQVANPSFIGRRQQHMNFAARTALEFTPLNEGEVAGLVLLQNEDYQYRLESALIDGEGILRLIKRAAGKDETLALRPHQATGRLYLMVEAIEQAYSFYFATNSEQWELLYDCADGRILSSDVAGGFTGAYLGMYASSNGQPSTNQADFDYFEYSGIFPNN